MVSMTKSASHPVTNNRIAVLLTNLGTPSAPTPKAIRRFLAEFLSDRRIVKMPRLIWQCILHGMVLRIRPRAAAKCYQSIWTAEGSPLLVISQKIAAQLQQHFDQQYPGQVKVVLGMRYGQPSIPKALQALREDGVKRLVVMPLFPQYSAATTASSFDCIAAFVKQQPWLPQLRLVAGYADHPGYIQALANHIQAHWQQHGRGEKLLISFHGLPQRDFEQGDPYYCYCHKTARLVAEQLQLADESWQLVFQSRFGRQRWLQPYCIDVLMALAKQGCRTVDVICPGFATDCLETLEEMATTNCALFRQYGGSKLNYIAALNDSSDHVVALANIVHKNMDGWISRS